MAQQDENFPAEGLYKVGVQGATNGLGIFFRDAFPMTNKTLLIWHSDLSSLRHPQEKQIINTRTASPRPYVYNKINRVYSFRNMMGVSYLFADRSAKNSIRIAFHGMMGPAMHFIKPIYLEVTVPDPQNANNYIEVSKRYEPEKINQDDIIGYSPFFTGIQKIKTSLGASAKGGISFQWGNDNTTFKSMEIGVSLDWIPTAPPIMYKIKNKNFFTGFYISFALGNYKI